VQSINDVEHRFKNNNFIYLKDFIPSNSINELLAVFKKHHQSKFTLYTQFGYDYWNLENVIVLEYNTFLYNTLKSLTEIKIDSTYNFTKKRKNFSVFVGASCFERINFLTFLGYTNNLKNSYYTLKDKTTTCYYSDSKKYELLFGENFEKYQQTFKTKVYSYRSFSKYNHKKNYDIIKKLLSNSYYYIALENQPFTGYDNISEKSLFGYLSNLPTFNVIPPLSRQYLKGLGFKSLPLFDIEKNYNKCTIDETLIEYARDISFLNNLTHEQWIEYYHDNSTIIQHNFQNLISAEKIIKNNMLVALNK
jgi:hypothetical protein